MDSDIDPDWAWSEFVPGNDVAWDCRTAAHLHRRAGFGATMGELETSLSLTPSAAVDRLLDATEPVAFIEQMSRLSVAALATGEVQRLAAWWIYRMLATPAQLQEKLTLFWHGHFATSAANVTDGRLMLNQNLLLRSAAAGDFSRLLLEISRDPAMLIYLDSVTNRRSHPNENFAREIMELFCLGEGHYSENDIRELARCFTGWEVKREKFRFNRYQHDEGTKSILNRTGRFGGEDAVRIVSEQPAAPEFIVARLIRCFLRDEPRNAPALVAPLARFMRDSGMQVRPVLKRILVSNLFVSKYALARRVRSPAELLIGLLRCMDGTTNTFELADQMAQLGQSLFFPPSVKGWDGGRTWINSSTLLGRSNSVRRLLENDRTRFDGRSLEEYLSSQNLTSSGDLLDRLDTLVFAVPIPDPARDRVIALIDTAPSRSAGLTDGLHALFTLPEFQLC